MFALDQDWFMVFPALARLVIFTAEHVYSGNPGDRFSAQGVISYNKLPIYNWYEAVWVYMKHGVYNKQYSLAKRADNIGYYLVFKTYVGCFSSKSMVSTWFVSYLLVYTWHTPLHYPHAANAGCVLAGVAPVAALTHWGRVTHICVSNLTIIGSDNSLSPGRRQAIIWTNAGILLIGPLGTIVSEILIEIYSFLFKKMHLNMSSGKWLPFCLGLNVLKMIVCGIVITLIPNCYWRFMEEQWISFHYLF